MENDNEFRSNDFYLVSVCIASGASLISLERKNQNFFTFVLDIPKDEAEMIIASHWNKTLKLPTRDLIEAINQLKTRLHSGV